MSKEFQKLLESELLTEETKTALQTAIVSFREEAITEAKKELEVDYAKKMLVEKEELSVKMIELITESVSKEIEELKEDIKYYKNIEPKYATKLENFKKEYSEKMTASFENLVESHVKEEMKELTEDLMEAKKNHLGMQIFEAFRATFEKLGVSEDVATIKNELTKVKADLAESKLEIAKMDREKVMEGLLNNLKGGKRDIMKTILENVNTDKLEERYNETIESVLEDSKEKNEDKKVIITEAQKNDSAELDRLRVLIGK